MTDEFEEIKSLAETFEGRRRALEQMHKKFLTSLTNSSTALTSPQGMQIAVELEKGGFKGFCFGVLFEALPRIVAVAREPIAVELQVVFEPYVAPICLYVFSDDMVMRDYRRQTVVATVSNQYLSLRLLELIGLHVIDSGVLAPSEPEPA